MPALTTHSATPCPAITEFTASAQRAPDGIIVLTYLIKGDVNQIDLPEKAASVQTDGLWQHTCFEAFARTANESAYREFNFVPSSAYAAYSFTDYREGMQPLLLDAAPQIDMTRHETLLKVSVQLPAGSLPRDTLLALAAVIELKDGSKSYWALTHVGDNPDFHHKDGFVLKL